MLRPRALCVASVPLTHAFEKSFPAALARGVRLPRTHVYEKSPPAAVVQALSLPRAHVYEKSPPAALAQGILCCRVVRGPLQELARVREVRELCLALQTAPRQSRMHLHWSLALAEELGRESPLSCGQLWGHGENALEETLKESLRL